MSTVSITHNIDCMEYMKSFPDKYFDLAVVDPPYSIGAHKMAYTKKAKEFVVQENGSKLKVKQKQYRNQEWDNQPPPLEYFTELIRISKHQIIWGINYMPVVLTGGRLIWNKLTAAGLSFSDSEIAYCSLHNKVETVYYLWSGMMHGKQASQDIRKALLQKGDKQLNENRIHETQKPIPLYQWIFQEYLPLGGKVMDTHMGSGSSRIAAHLQNNIDFYGCEINSQIFQDQEDRFQNHIKQLSLF